MFLQIPSSLGLAVKSQEVLAAAAAERAEMKRLVLQASEEQAEYQSYQAPQPNGPHHPAKSKNSFKGARRLEIPIELSDAGDYSAGRGRQGPPTRGHGPARPSRYDPSFLLSANLLQIQAMRKPTPGMFANHILTELCRLGVTVALV